MQVALFGEHLLAFVHLTNRSRQGAVCDRPLLSSDAPPNVAKAGNGIKRSKSI
jgi:hypothetical protein